jgi:2-polyprenyl-3-methyl-5-hydroxy-6-metoxy-1,4-benzoquinol methylase
MPANTAPSLDVLFGGIMKRHGVTCTAEEFHRAVNVTFHEFESQTYDSAHRDMWDSLPQQFSLLVEDWLRVSAKPPGEIHLLDIGCGTGLASDSMIRTAVGGSIQSVTLLDTSPAMLRRASQRAAGWRIPFRCHEGTVESCASGTSRYQAIVTCSVLHHVPDLAAFLRAVRNLQADGGAFFHLQDPNGDYAGDPILRERMAQVAKPLPEWCYRFAPNRIVARLVREWTGKQGQDEVSQTNRALLEKGIVSSPLSVQEMFSITDIHVHDSQGISIGSMKTWMPDYELVSQRSYGFFGQLGSTLAPPYARQEQDLIAARTPNGIHIGAAWQLRANQAR